MDSENTTALLARASTRTAGDPVRLLAQARNLAAQKEWTLGLIDYGRVLGASTPGELTWAEAANDIGVIQLQRQRGDLAYGFLRAASEAFPAREVFASNFAAVRNQAPAQGCPAPAIKGKGGTDKVGAWELNVLNHCEELVSFQRRRVLEIGGALPTHAVEALRPRSWTSVDPRAEASDNGIQRVLNVCAEAVPLPDQSIDLAFSSCSFEHILDLPAVLAETRRLLCPGGLLFTEFSPIWSALHGHHVWISADKTAHPVLTFLDGVLPAWSHLIWKPEDMRAFLAPTHGAKTAERAAHSTYRGSYINRLFEDDYYRIFHESGLIIERLEPLGQPRSPSARLQARLEAAQPSQRSFSSAGFRLLARKR